MGKLINIVSKLHQSTKRDYLKRMIDEKVECMKIAKKYEKEYWDGDRRYGYGGYKYIPGRWKSVAEMLIGTAIPPAFHIPQSTVRYLKLGEIKKPILSSFKSAFSESKE